ncbi:MAG: tRNA (N6-isopentenyl adenosine(37)-C2)-methylthiotransferase MiaB [Defluviitaleaceae bacterium]|nr:tRNA (N6-isopentenyl adenosine(37)-C2)-methylthiotransferase MiaB [Defluviitaleaceae bacterium]
MDNTKKREVDVTNYYIEKMAAIVAKTPAIPKALIVTHGCQMNARDSEKLRGMLVEMGYEVLDKDTENPDLVIFNTCCVRENAENKLYGNLGEFKIKKRENRNLKIVLCGCMMQQDIVVDKIMQSYNYVDVIFGTHNIYRFPELLHSNYITGSNIIDIWKDAEEIVEDLPSIREFPHKASVNIMYGCDNFCTFCIVPYVRGRERSRAPEDILNEIRAQVADGVSEITLLGQNVDSYGKGLETEINFAKLLHMVSEIDGLHRIRFTSNHPKDVSDDVIQAMCNLDKVCKHLHLPFQAGSTRVLNAMNRGYTKEEYLDLVARIKVAMPQIAITTDIMVGFPSETEEDFEDTLDVVRKARFAGAFTFMYSRRQGTVADTMPDHVPQDVMKQRFNRLLTEVNRIAHEVSIAKQGKILQVMPEVVGKNGILNGRADDNSLVHFVGDVDLLGTLVDVKITEARTFYLNGEIV